MLDGFQAIVGYVNEQPIIQGSLQTFLFGYIHNFWFIQIGAANTSVFGLGFLKNNLTDYCHLL